LQFTFFSEACNKYAVSIACFPKSYIVILPVCKAYLDLPAKAGQGRAYFINPQFPPIPNTGTIRAIADI